MRMIRVGLLSLLAFAGRASAQPPALLPYQGFLTDAGGVPVNTTVQVTARLHETVDATDPLWIETHEDVAVSGGFFELRLGSVAGLDLADEAFASALDSGDLFLSLQVNDDVEMEPRQRLLSVPWAWRASSATDAMTVGGQAPSSFATTSHTHEGWDVVSAVEECNEAATLACEGCVDSGQIADGSITLADVAGNGCAAGQTFLWEGTAWECGSAALPVDVVDGSAFDDRFLSLEGGALSGGLAIAPAAGVPAVATLTGNGLGGEAALVLEGAGGPWVVSADDVANLFGIYGSGAPRLVIDGGGSVGIGTAAPTAGLDVHSGGIPAFVAVVDAGPGIGARAAFGANNGFASLGLGNVLGDGAQLVNTTGGWQWSTQLNVMGAVGIGTTTPGSQLEIQDSNKALTNATPSLAVLTSDTFGVDLGGSLGLGGKYNTGGNQIAFASIHGKKENSADNNALGYFAITTRDAVGTAERLRITSSGNVGIGTATPTVGLQLQYRNLGVNVDGVNVNPPTYVGTTQFQARSSGTPILPPGTFSTTHDRWKILLQGSWADDYHGGGAGPYAGWMEFTDQFPTRNIHGRTIRIEKNGSNEFVATSTSTNLFSGEVIIAPNFGSGTEQVSIDVRGAIIAGEDAVRLDPLGPSYITGGNVGIGTTSPGHRLQVVGDGILVDDGSGRGQFWRPDGSGLAWSLTNGVNHSFGEFQVHNTVGNVTNVVVSDNGYMGIGTNGVVASNTGARLVVNGAIEAGGQGDAPTAYAALVPSTGSGAAARIQTGATSPATDLVIAPAGAEALRVTTSSGTQVQGNLYVNAAGGMPGNLVATGHIIAHSTLHIGDLAEEFPLAEGERAEAGDVLVIDPQHPGKLRRSGEAYDSKVVGIVSEQPTFRIGVKGGGVPVALVGRAQVKVVGPVKPGDFLVAAGVPGCAMRAADPGRGGVLGTAMTGFNGARDARGAVIAFVHLQPAPTGDAVSADEMRMLRERVERLEAERRVQVSAASFALPPDLVLILASGAFMWVLVTRRRRGRINVAFRLRK